MPSERGMRIYASLALAAAVACSSPPAPKAPPGASTSITSADAEATSDVPEPVASPACELACGSAVATLTAGAIEPDHHAAAVGNVDAVFASMHDDLLACYRARLARVPSTQAFVQLSLVLEPDGRVRSVDATGGGMLGPSGLRCLTRRVERAVFAPVHGGGTLRVEVPLTFRRLSSSEIE